MNRPGGGPQPLRGIPAFLGPQQPQQPQQQPPQQGRNSSMGSTRLQTSKSGSGSGWGFMGAAPGLQNPPARPNNAMTSFAQTIGGSQPNTPLDMSEFPSLSGAPSQHPQLSSQSSWANATQRSSSQTPVQRPSQQQQQNQSSNALSALSYIQHQNQAHQQHTPQDQNDGALQNSSQLSGGLDDYRYGGQDAIGQLPGSSRPKTGSIDDFPPLGQTGGDELGQDRRSNLLHAVGFGRGSEDSHNLPIRGNTLGSLSSTADGNRAGGRLSPAGLGSGAFAGSPLDSIGQGPTQTSNLQNGHDGSSIFSSSQSPQGSHAARPPSLSTSYPSQQSQRGQTTQSTIGSDFTESGTQMTPSSDPLSSMSDIDRFGLRGLANMIRSEGSDITTISMGQDLNGLGMDLHPPDNNPLYLTFASPFAGAGTRLVDPEYSIPSCYGVQNIQPLVSKVNSFTDETLFYIFYAMPRDVLQEIVASELSARNWRYHKELKQWLTKDASCEPQRISAGEERGYYIFFDPTTWQRHRREFQLHYDSLDSRTYQPMQSISMH